MSSSSLGKYLSYLGGRPVVRLVTIQLGVWGITFRETSNSLLTGIPTRDGIKDIIGPLPALASFLKEIYGIAPWQFIVTLLELGWSGVESGLSLYATGNLVNMAVLRIQGSDIAASDMYSAMGFQLGLVVLNGIIGKINGRCQQVLSDRITFHYKAKSMHTVLNRLDKTTDAKNMPMLSLFQLSCSSQSSCSGDFNATDCLKSLLHILAITARGVSQTYFGIMLVRSYPFDPWFLSICVLGPLLRIMGPGKLFSLEYVLYCADAAYKRLTALNDLAFNKSFWTDIQSDGVGGYIEREYAKERQNVGDKSTEHVISQLVNQGSMFKGIGLGIVHTLPTLYFAFKSVAVPGSLSISSFTTLQHAAEQVSWTLYFMSREIPKVQKVLKDIQEAHNDRIAAPKTKDGQTEYPKDDTFTSEHGMGIEFRDVSFVYPGTTKNAISNITFTIKPGQLVAIVGMNGSGKSTVTHLFNRLYDPTQGEVLIDGLPLPSYKVGSVRKHMAILRQNHPIYPLSLRENIALGLPDESLTDEDLNAALKDGTAYNYVQELEGKLDTVLKPVKMIQGNLSEKDAPELKPLFDSEVAKDVSGGMSQRLAASRTFMRLRGGQIRFLAADEPSSALDPEAEYELFTRLRERRQGMTTVFITHRFGHVTKHADLILCLKEGELVEQGTHEELIAKGGEYQRLYAIQADAFSQAPAKVEAQIPTQADTLQSLQQRLLQGDLSALADLQNIKA